MDDRAKSLLKTLVELYIAEGTPVGSRTLSRASGLELSPATIRNVMADLEDLGLIASPHTSAGRIPTARGYRVFVDTMLTARPLERQLRLGARAIAAGAADARDRQRRAHPVSLSNFVGVVTAPKKASVFHHIEFMRLGERRVLLILVAPDGDVQNRVIMTARDYTQAELVEAANFLNTHYAGLTIDAVRERLQQEVETLRSEIATLMQAAVQAGTEAMAERRATRRQRRAQPAHGAGLRQRHGLAAQAVRSVRAEDATDAPARRVAAAPRACASTSAASRASCPTKSCRSSARRTRWTARVVGTLGVIGPTRMAYDRMIQIVDITSKLVSNALWRRGRRRRHDEATEQRALHLDSRWVARCYAIHWQTLRCPRTAETQATVALHLHNRGDIRT